MRVDSAAGQVGQGSTGECFQGVFASCGIPSLSNCHEGLEREDSPPIINKLMRHVNDSTIRHFGSVINVNAGGAVLLWNLAQTPDGFETVEVHKHSQLEDWRPMIEVRPPTTAALRWSALSDCMHYGAPRAPSDSLCVYGDDDVRRRSPRAFPSVHAIDNEQAPRTMRTPSGHLFQGSDSKECAVRAPVCCHCAGLDRRFGGSRSCFEQSQGITPMAWFPWPPPRTSVFLHWVLDIEHCSQGHNHSDGYRRLIDAKGTRHIRSCGQRLRFHW